MFSRLLPGALAAAILSASSFAEDFPTPYNTEEADAPPMSAEEAAKSATLPEGFRLEVFASEPDVQQPISIAFDDGGRLWVGECYTFAERPMRWDLELNDRIIVLEDTDNDGTSDRRTIFWDEGKRLMSALPGEGGIWALCPPQLLFIPDADDDLKPDGEPVVMLDGFEAETIGHNIANGLKEGPDGWIYGRHGITATSLVGKPGTPTDNRTALNCSIWRFHPETHDFEVFSNGGTNPWGLDWDKNGQLFYTNTVIGHLWHGIPGAYYTRMFGVHLNRHVYEVIPHTADHYHWDTGSESWNDIREGVTDSTSLLGGGHAHMGCLIYEGGVWPEKYRGNLFTCNLHGRRVNQDILKREGVGYVAEHGKDFLMMEDPWFRGLDLITGPDGQVWMSDWSDTGECHDNDAIHRTSGRIYRIVYDGPDKGTPTPDRPDWLSMRGKAGIEKLITSDDEAKQAMGVRWLAEQFPDEAGTVETLTRIASNTPKALVRMELASALQRLPAKDRFAIATILCEHEGDADDRQQPLLIYYGIESVIANHPEQAIQLALSSKLPKVTKLIAWRLTENLESDGDAVNDLLSGATTAPAPITTAVLAGLTSALQGWSQTEMPTAWEAFAASAAKTGDQDSAESIRELSLLFGDGRAREELIEIATNKEADGGARRAALKNLLKNPDEELLPLLKTWVTDKVISEEAVRGLALYDGPGISVRIIQYWKRAPLGRETAISTLVSRPGYARDLLSAIEKGNLPRDAISPFQARQIVSLGDEDLKKQLSEVWGEIRETPAAMQAEIKKWKKTLSEEAMLSADPARGKIVFSQSCGACHQLYGEGGKLGPDLTGSDRHNLDYLLANTINPSDVVPADYRLTVFTLKDGRVVSGVVPEENDKTVSVQSAAGTERINTADINKRETLPVSLMPEGLLNTLSVDAVKDLIAYLKTTAPLTP